MSILRGQIANHENLNAAFMSKTSDNINLPVNISITQDFQAGGVVTGGSLVSTGGLNIAMSSVLSGNITAQSDLYVTGKIGVDGTTTPAYPIQVAAGTGTRMGLGSPSSSAPTMLIGRAAGQASIKADGENWLMLEGALTTGTVGLNYYASGQVNLAYGGGTVVIGRTAPTASYRLDVNGNSLFTGVVDVTGDLVASNKLKMTTGTQATDTEDTVITKGYFDTYMRTAYTYHQQLEMAAGQYMIDIEYQEFNTTDHYVQLYINTTFIPPSEYIVTSAGVEPGKVALNTPLTEDSTVVVSVFATQQLRERNPVDAHLVILTETHVIETTGITSLTVQHANFNVLTDCLRVIVNGLTIDKDYNYVQTDTLVDFTPWELEIGDIVRFEIWKYTYQDFDITNLDGTLIQDGTIPDSKLINSVGSTKSKADIAYNHSQTAHVDPETIGAMNGLATLGADGIVPANQLPAVQEMEAHDSSWHTENYALLDESGFLESSQINGSFLSYDPEGRVIIDKLRIGDYEIIYNATTEELEFNFIG